MEEIWKDICFSNNGIKYNYKGIYKISNLGRIKSLERLDNKGRTVHEKILSSCKRPDGYYTVGLSINGKAKSFLIHRLVALTFIPNPDNLPEINHKDENKSNNCVDNLEWCTSKYNCNYGTHNERVSKTKTGKPIKLTDEELERKRNFMMSEKNPMRRDDIREKFIGENNPFYGKTHTKESLEKMRKAKQNMSEDKKNEIKEKIKDANRTIIVQLNNNHEILHIWNSIKDASDNLGITSSPICRCCKGTQNKSKGYYWKYLSDVSDEEIIEYFIKMIINKYE